MARPTFLAGSTAALIVGALLASTSASATTPPGADRALLGSSAQVHFLLPPPPHKSVAPRDDEREGAPPLVNRGGPIMKSEKSYAIFWDPGKLQDGTPTQGITKKYQSLIARYFGDVNGSGLWRNNKQYKSQGQTPGRTSFGAIWIDKTPFPKNSCSYADVGSNCVTDADIQARVVADAAKHGIGKSMTKMFFVYTPQDEGSCFDPACSAAAYEYYCAYHGVIHVAGGSLIYANMPFPTVSSGNNCYYPAGGPQQFPNDLNADAAINVTSHEQIEAVTDPVINAWLDGIGYEIGDECAWNFGATLRSGGDINLSGHPYGLQKEASNKSENCVLKGP